MKSFLLLFQVRRLFAEKEELEDANTVLRQSIEERNAKLTDALSENVKLQQMFELQVQKCEELQNVLETMQQDRDAALACRAPPQVVSPVEEQVTRSESLLQEISAASLKNLTALPPGIVATFEAAKFGAPNSSLQEEGEMVMQSLKVRTTRTESLKVVFFLASH